MRYLSIAAFWAFSASALANESLVAILKREVERDQRVSCVYQRNQQGSAPQLYLYRCSDAQGQTKAEIRAVYENVPGDILGRRTLRTLETRFID